MKDKFNIVKALEEKDFVGIKDFVKSRVDTKFKQRVDDTKKKIKEKKT